MGDKVRVSHFRIPFTREYDEKWSGEIFIISDRRLRGGLPVYKLKDYMDEEIKGLFYQLELQKIEVRETDSFKVEKILKIKVRGQNKQYFVKGYIFLRNLTLGLKKTTYKFVIIVCMLLLSINLKKRSSVVLFYAIVYSYSPEEVLKR